MEEILASIRKIIADDDALPLTRPVAEPRTNFSTPKPFDKPFDTPADEALDHHAETNVTPISMRSPLVIDEPEEGESHEPEMAAPAAALVETASEDTGLRLDPVEDLYEGAPAPAQDEEPAPTLDHEAGAIAFGSTVLDPSPEEDDLASLAEIASELSAHDLLPAIADESPQEVFSEIRAASEAHEEQPTITPPPIPPATEASAGDDAAMLSPESDASVASAFRALSASVQLASSETIDRQVRELLRPMLKQWLDDNLPVMVERLVRAEIARGARGGR